MGGIQFSDTTNRDGLIELIERNTNTQSATTSDYPLKVKTADVNEALGNFFLLATKASGRFQFDDTNQTDLPVITTDLVASQQDYTFLVDSSTPANLIMDVRQVRRKDSSGNWKTITQIDRESFDINSYEGVTGTPEYFDVTGNSIILYPKPSYNSDEGLELYISRTPAYFASTDTTKKAGIPYDFHPYLHFRPSYLYCMINDLPQAAGLKIEVDKYETMIKDYYTRRNRTERQRLSTNQSGNNSAR